MRLRARLLLTVLVGSVPLTVGLVYIAFVAQQRAAVEAIVEATVDRMEEGGRERCERLARRPVRGPGRGRRGRRFRRQVRVYDDALEARLPSQLPLEDDLRAAIAGGAPYASSWTADGRLVVAVRMPWDGPCAVVVVERPVGRPLQGPGLLRIVALGLLVNALTALVALAALGPVVGRLRRLARAVRRSAAEGYGGEVEVRGRDEVADLARAFNDAAREVRGRVEALEQRDEALREYLARTTHDVMVPLTVLQGHLVTLRGRARGDVPEALRGALEESQYLASLLRNLSSATRLDAGEPQIARHPLDMRDVVERAVARHRPIGSANGVELAHAVPEGPVTVVADSTLAEQAVSNLVHNAIRYNRSGGHVAVILELAPPGFVLRVKDDGPGIPEDELARVTERRFRGGEARRRHPSGLGLGLPIVRDVCERHGWSLGFEGPEEGGLEVTVRGTVTVNSHASGVTTTGR